MCFLGLGEGGANVCLVIFKHKLFFIIIPILKSNKNTCLPYISRLASAVQITLKYLDVTAQLN